MPKRLVEGIDEAADQQHAKDMPCVAAGYLLEHVLGEMQRLDEERGGEAADRAEQHIER